MSETQSNGSTIRSQTREAPSFHTATNEQPTIPRERIGPSAVGQVLILLSFLLLGFLTYSNTFHSPFRFDDLINIEENVHIRMTELTWQEIADVFKSKAWARPVAMLSFAFNYYFDQYNVEGYHLVNILIHGINAVLLYFFLRTTLGLRPHPLPHSSWAAFFAALLWLLHPVQTQSVTYIVQRINSLAAMFYILSLLLYAKGRIDLIEKKGSLQGKRPASRIKPLFPYPFLWFTGSSLAGILAIGCKEISVTLPFFILLYEWYFFQDLSWPWLRRWLPWVLGACIPVATLAVAHFGFHLVAELPTWYKVWDFTLPQRVLTEFRVVIYYVSLLFYPHPSRLNLDYDFPLSYSLLDPPTTLLSFSIIVGLLGLACWLARRERVLSFCILWFFGNLVIESSVIPLDLVFEHRLYLPSMLVSLVVVGGIYRHIRPKQLATGLLCLAAVVLSVWTYQRNEVWRDPIAFWSDTVKKSPNKARPYNNLAEALAEQGNYDGAIAQYLESLRINPGLANVHNNLGNAFFNQGKLDQAIAQYRRSLQIDPKYAKPHTNLGIALAQQGKRKEAIHHFGEALRIDPYHAKAYNGLGIALAQQGKRKEAIAHFRQALRIQPHHAGAHNNLGKALAQQGNLEEAIVHYREALRIDPYHAQAHYSLANILAQQGDPREANVHYQQAKRINPNIRIPAMIP